MKILDYEGLTYLIEKIKGLLSKKADTTYVDSKVKTYGEVTTDENGLMIAADKVKLNSISDNANNYTHPGSHPASIITETTTKRFVSDSEKTAWNAKLEASALTPLETSISDLSDRVKTDVPSGAVFTDTIVDISGKVDKISGKGLSTNDYTTTEKTKLSGVEDGANKYVHPSTHPASMITESTTKRFVTDTEKATWTGRETTADAQAKATKALTDANEYTDEKLVAINGRLDAIESRLDAIEAVDGE